MRSPIGRLIYCCLTASLLGAGERTAGAQYAQASWPQEIDTDSATVVIYEPQPISLTGIVLTARAAFSVTKKSGGDPVFGVMWLTSRAQTDRDSRMMAIDQIKITDVRFPGVADSAQQQFKRAIEPKIEGTQFSVSMDGLDASLTSAAAEQRSADSLNTTPPKIIFSTTPAVLLLYSGNPVTMPLPNSSLKSVVNTPMMVALDPATSTYYLNGGPLWYSAKAALGPWASITKPPPAVGALVPDSVQRDSAPPGGPPKIIVATSPTELIVTRGEPVWTPVTGSDVLYVSNTDASVFKDLKDQKTYVLLSGRWFRAGSSAGPWTFVRPDSLPADFAKIPPASAAGDVLASVPGTDQAKDAVMDTQIPQTAAVDRATATVTIAYDGDPRFSTIPGTQVEYAINTSSQVLRIGGLYYACDKAVWFVAKSAKGPWAVSDSVPKAVSTIPPSAPVYNVKYVEVYQSTPTVVYVGYTPGYTFAYPYYGTVVYGTGFVYPAYVSPVVYYPPPVTYGVAVRYNPWTGWTVGFGYSTPFMHVGVVVRPGYGGWYGPYGRPPYPPPYYRPPYYGYPGYRPPYGHPGYPPPGYPGYRPPGYGPPPSYPGYRPPAAGTPRPTPYTNNIYRQPENANRTRPATLPATGGPTARPAKLPNNVVGGQDGNVYRKDGNNWQTRQGNQWQGAGGTGGTKPAGPSTGVGTKPAPSPGVGVSPTPAPSGGARPAAPSAGGGARPAPSTGVGGGAGGAKPSTPATRPPSPAVPSQVTRDYQARQNGNQQTQQFNRAQTGGASRPSTPPAPRPSTGGASRGGSAGGGGARPR
jgi:hypothetical protein